MEYNTRKTVPFFIEVKERLLPALRQIARRKRIPLQILINAWLRDKAEQELERDYRDSYVYDHVEKRQARNEERLQRKWKRSKDVWRKNKDTQKKLGEKKY